MTRPVIEGMRERGFGRSSTSPRLTAKRASGQTNYTASKSGDIGFTKILAQEKTPARGSRSTLYAPAISRPTWPFTARRPYRLDRGQRTTGMAKGDRLWPPARSWKHHRSIQTDYWPATSSEAAIGVAVLNRMLGPVARIPSVPPRKPHDPGDKAQTSLLKFSVQQRLANRRLLHQREAA